MAATQEDKLDLWLDLAIDTARAAGDLIGAAYRRPHQIDRKSSLVDLVTETDLAAEKLIRERLAEETPGFGVLGEEGGVTDGSGDEGERGRWIVDPLDGTTNFAHGHPFYCVSIALELEGRLELGVIHAPTLGLTWWARRGGGCYRNGAGAAVSKISKLTESLCASGFPYDRRTAEDNNSREWAAVIRAAQGVRRCGSAALDLALIADGTYDGFWEKRLNPWDMAAGVVLVEEAGGRVTSLDGAPVPPWPETIVATNGLVHDELRGVLLGVSSKHPSRIKK